MPADQGGSSGSRTIVKPKTVSKTVSRAVSRTANKVKKYASSPRSNTTQGTRRVSSGSSRKSSSSSSRGYSSRSSSRGSSGGGGGSSYSAPKVAKAPGIASYLGTDSVYQQALRGGKRSLADFISELGRRRGEATTQFNTTKSSMERDRTQQLEALRDEFASRGLIQSSLFGEEQGRFQQQFQTQMDSLGQQQTALLADLMGQQKNYQRENDLAIEAARQEALQRRAARYKIGA